MEIKTEIETKIEIVTDIICDCCGESCLPKVASGKFFPPLDYGYDARNIGEFLTIKGNWGYSSKKDTERWEAHICEKCVDEKLGFIKFKKTDYTNGKEIKQ